MRDGVSLAESRKFQEKCNAGTGTQYGSFPTDSEYQSPPDKLDVIFRGFVYLSKRLWATRL